MAKANKTAEVKEPSILVRPVARMGGLDNIHLALLVLVAILIAIIVVVSYSKPVLIKNEYNCTYGMGVNSTCYTPVQNATSVIGIVEKRLAAYAYVNNSNYYLIAYEANVMAMNLTFIPSGKYWLARIPLASPYTGNLTMVVNDQTGTVVSSSYQIFNPPGVTNNQVVAQGVIKLTKQTSCIEQFPVHVQWFMDPYAPGAVQSLLNATALEARLGSKLNVSFNMVNGQYTQAYASTYGENDSLALSQYVFCASQQPQFAQFVSRLNDEYDNTYLSPNTLSGIASASGLNSSALGACISSSGPKLSAQSQLLTFYGVSLTPAAVTNCEYLSLPQGAAGAVCYTNSTTC